jgi:hypothetical protein
MATTLQAAVHCIDNHDQYWMCVYHTAARIVELKVLASPRYIPSNALCTDTTAQPAATSGVTGNALTKAFAEAFPFMKDANKSGTTAAASDAPT